jgi:aminoglycoside/choline kinase family phosphotransferase
MKETQAKARVARFKEQVKAQVRVQDKVARALVRVARVKEQDKVQNKVARELGKVQVKDLGKKGISKKRVT